MRVRSTSRTYGLAVAAALAALTALFPAGTTAYASTSSTAQTARPSAAADYPEYINGYVRAADGLNMRTGPGTGYSTVGTLPYGQLVEIGCWAPGTWVSAIWPSGYHYATGVWDAIIDRYHNDRIVAWVSDAWLDTGGDSSQLVKPC